MPRLTGCPHYLEHFNTVVNGNGIQVEHVNKEKIPIKCVPINRELLYTHLKLPLPKYGKIDFCSSG